MSALGAAARNLWPAPGDRHGPLVPLLIVLTFVTGVVDAASYLRLGHVFVANMTGNIVFLGFALAGAGGLSAVSSLVALGSFLLGALGGGRLGARHSEHRGRLLRAAGIVQVGLMALALVLSVIVRRPLSSAASYALIVPLALAMGVQNAAAQRLAVPELTTTVLTRTLTGLAADASLARPDPQAPRRIAAVLAMLLGALCGGLLVLHVSITAAIALATAIVAVVGGGAHLGSRSHAAWTRA